MIELRRLRLINWHSFENATFDCARLTYMIGVNAVGKTTILDAVRYCLTTNRSFNTLGNKKSGRTLQGSVHAKQRGENVYRRPGRTVAYIGLEFSDDRRAGEDAAFVIAVRVESESPYQELRPGDQTWYVSEPGCTLDMLPFLDERGAPTAKEAFRPAKGRLAYTRSPSDARDKICRALGIGRASDPLGKRFFEVFQMGTSMDEIPNFREFLYQYILPQPEIDLEALQSDRIELESLHAVLAQTKERAAALEEIVTLGREAEQLQTEADSWQGAVLLAQAQADADALAASRAAEAEANRRLAALRGEYAAAKSREEQARRAYLAAHSAAAASDDSQMIETLDAELEAKKAECAALAQKADARGKASKALGRLADAIEDEGGLTFPPELRPEKIEAAPKEKQALLLEKLGGAVSALATPAEEQCLAARQTVAELDRQAEALRAERQAVDSGRWVYPQGDAATHVRDAINAELAARGLAPEAKIFCEVLNIKDESWQDAVEACLGGRRFDILVPVNLYLAARAAFLALGQKVGPIALIDTPALRRRAAANRELPPESLAAQLDSENTLAGQYAAALLGRIICCETPDTLEQYPDSVTKTLLRHYPYRTERLRSPQRYIGMDARRARTEALDAAMAELAAKRAEAARAEKQARSIYGQIQSLTGGALAPLIDGWDAPERLAQCQAEAEALAAKRKEYVESPLLRTLYRDEEARESAWDDARGELEKLGGDIRLALRRLDDCEAGREKAESRESESKQAAEQFFIGKPLLRPLAEKQLAESGEIPAARLENARRAKERLGEKARTAAATRLEPAQRAYNERYVCDYKPGLEGMPEYRRQYESLVRIDLERYSARLEKAQQDCKDRFRKDVLFRMKDDIFNARRQFRELNRVMEQLSYGEEIYRFELEPSHDPTLAGFYRLIVDKGNMQMTADDSLDNLAATADPAYEQQVDELMERIMADVDAAARARQEGRRPESASLSEYVDYRTYLDYDILVTNKITGQKAYLSRVSRDSSGGENQAPFYVAICASLLQIYQKSENCIRLVLLDEAFSRMTSDRIRPMMELFRRMDLQVILISTVEKSSAIQPWCDLTYSIVRRGNANAIAPFYKQTGAE